MSKNTTRRWGMAALTAVVCIGSTALTAPSAPAAQPTFRTAAVSSASQYPEALQAAPRISRAEVLARAKTWLTANNGRPVPYSQNKHWKDGYRQDCSGYVSMALGLAKPGPNTVALKNNGFTRRIAMSRLAPAT
ncbi:hypothetical protein WKI68_13630 [Streptomyces sp. MS1.HAVA.3]|uniref:Uncharacterized protein n=1 Tax=Streptomyces caledonius TaxID=3134107 RepID=A0ABU8U2W4_9ACTN